MTERWRAIPGYEESYLISDTGFVKSVRFGRLLNPTPVKNKLSVVVLSVKANKKRFTLKELVELTFPGECLVGHEECKVDGETWKTSFIEGYDVSNFGRVRSSSARMGTTLHKIIKLQLHPAGYWQVRLHPLSGKATTYVVHQMVAVAFLGDRRSEGLEVCHQDNNKKNNLPQNLRWDTRSENMKDISRAGYYKNQNTQKTHCINGHLLDGENVYKPENYPGKLNSPRVCKACSHDRYVKYKNAKNTLD